MSSETEIGRTLSRLRDAAKISAQTLADRTEGMITRGVIANIETGRKKDITIRELLVLCQALDCLVTDLVPALSPHVADGEAFASARRALDQIHELSR